MVVMLDWDDMAALEAALGSEIGQRTAKDAATYLARYATFRGVSCNSTRSDRGGRLCETLPASVVVESGMACRRRRHVHYAQTCCRTKLAA